MRVLLCIILIFSVALETAGQTRAPEIKFRFKGNEQVRTSELASTLRNENLLSYRTGIEHRIREAITKTYFQRGFYLFLIDSLAIRPSEDTTVYIGSLSVSEGPQFKIGTIEFKGNSVFPSDRLLKEFDLASGDVFTDAIIRKDVGRILALYDRSGYPFASVSIDNLTLRHDSDSAFIDVLIGISEGEKFIISEITVEGNTQTNTDVIIRETRIGKDEPYNAEKVNEIQSRIERLNFFSSVSEPELYLRNEKGGLLIRIVEGNTNIFDGVVGYQPPRDPQESGYLTGLVNLSFRNLFGTGRRFDARWERATRDITELEIRYLEPWLLSFPLNIQGGFFQRQQDSAYIRRTLDGKLTYLATASLSFSASVQSAQVIPSQNSIFATLPYSSTLTGGLEFQIDTRDNVYNPFSGIHLRNGYYGGNKRLIRAGTDETTSDFIQRIELDLSTYFELFSRNIAAASLHGRELRGDELDVSDLYRLGGANTLRGYREQQFMGTRLGWLNLEYRYSLGRRSFAFAFFDFGYVYQSASEIHSRPEFNAIRKGYGFGGRIETAIGVIGVSYALGQEDSITNGKIHFGLINEF